MCIHIPVWNLGPHPFRHQISHWSHTLHHQSKIIYTADWRDFEAMQNIAIKITKTNFLVIAIQQALNIKSWNIHFKDTDLVKTKSMRVVRFWPGLKKFPYYDIMFISRYHKVTDVRHPNYNIILVLYTQISDTSQSMWIAWTSLDSTGEREEERTFKYIFAL